MLADALICEALGISWRELQDTPEDVIVTRLVVKSRKAAMQKAMEPLTNG